MSTARRSLGLTLGKYAPLHRGHQLVIETALAEMDHLIILIYDSPEVTAVPLTVRAHWLRQLYPEASVIEAWDGPAEVGDTPEIRRMHEEYVIRQLGLRGITHFYSSEFYGEHMSRALGADNRQIDPRRASVPVSATQIRQNPYAYREFMHALVYRDLITNVAFLGAPSTGKTTIAEELARRYQTVWMPEYGREYWEQRQSERRLTPDQLVEIAEGHLEREERLLGQANRYLFTDTNAITTAMFALAYHGGMRKRLRQLALEAASRYDLVFLCDTDIPYEDTWDRSGDVGRQIFQKQIVADLRMRKIPFFTLRGDLEARAAAVRRVLERHQKYANLAEWFGLSTEQR
jgi:NadR type nicotinamide-nucleotide adenylyltransferase